MKYTTANKVRNLLPSLLTENEQLGELGDGTDEIIFLNNSAFAVPTILKNVTVLECDNDYTFIPPRTIKLNEPASGEHFTAHVHVAFSDFEIQEFIGQSDRIIDNAFAGIETPSDEYLDDWSQWLTAWKIKLVTAKGDPDLIKEAESFRTIVMKDIQNYKDITSENIINQSKSSTFNDRGVTRYDSVSIPSMMLDRTRPPRYKR